MKLRTAWLVLAVSVLGLWATNAQAVIIVGDPMEGNSWSQGFTETSGVDLTGPFDAVAIQIISAGPLESPGLSSFNPPGWSVAYNSLTNLAAFASRSSNSTYESFNVLFAGSSGSSLTVNFEAYLGGVLKDYDTCVWNGGWAITHHHAGIDPPTDGPSEGAAEAAAGIPEPASILVWSLLGAGSWFGLRVWRRRGGAVGRGPWSEESRSAIRHIIEQRHSQS
jgi:hypothetical protein